jgi:putative membrane-bound dehydrogenase-like protein
MKARLLFVLAGWLTPPAVLLAQLPPEKADTSFTVHNPDLQFKLWASEPLFANPTSIDIDHLGRVWVCESVNYRTKLLGKPLNRPAGDRILILEDGKGIGKADKVTVFYQSPELLAPLGIAVAKDPVGPGWKVYVCHSPDILVFEDKDGDGHADGPPKKLLTGFRGVDHDHGVHGISIGPDGKLYFSVGDQGVKDLQSSDGKGRKWTTNKTDCQAGTIWRCDLDGTNLELIAHNFRNEYEPCVDSFGNIWTSDNDDDGSEQTRICYVMPGGNYGYWPRGPGESHWHEEQPGVVPKVLRTGFGSPTGMCVYEGTLLPKQYQGQLLHTDAGPRHVRCYHTKPKGAGYEIEREDIVTSTDSWFRPSDICVAPDGSVFVADWYDPGVGGHGMGDTTRGRIYRLAPKGSKYAVPKVDLDRKKGILAALESPALSVRFMAMAKIQSLVRDRAYDVLDATAMANESPLLRAAGIGTPGALERLPMREQPDVLRARAHFQIELYGKKMATDGAEEFSEHGRAFMRKKNLLKEKDLQMRILSFRLGERGLLAVFSDKSREGILNDQSAAIRREALLEMRPNERDSERLLVEMAGPLMRLAERYDGNDRFYLAAIGIAVGTDPKRREIILADFEKQFPEWNDKVANLVWELRPPSVMPTLGKRLTDEKIPAAQRARIVDILATSGTQDAGLTLLKLLQADLPAEVKARAIENLRRFLPGKWAGLAKSDELKKAIDQLLAEPKSRSVGVQLVAAAKSTNAIEQLSEFAAAGDMEAILTLGQLQSIKAVAELDKLYRSNAKPLQSAGAKAEIVSALGAQLSGKADSPSVVLALVILQRIVNGKDAPIEVKQAALAALAGSRAGTQWLLRLKVKNELPAELVSETGRLLRNSPFQGLRNRAMIAFPASARLEINKLPPLAELAERHGDAERGKQVLAASVKADSQCMKCHAVKGVGGNVGPDLATIGTKASRENLYESIVFPSKAIADQFVQWNVTTTRGVTVSGLLVEENADHLTIRDANGKDHRIAREDVVEKAKNPKSIMPEDIAQALTEQELTDLVEYLMTLQANTPGAPPK